MRPALVALALALALAVVTACASGPPVGTSSAPVSQPGPDTPSGGGGAFEGCTAVFTAIFGWTFACDSTSIVTREGDDLEELLRGARESMRGAFAGPVEERRDDVRVGGVPRRGLELSLRTAKKQLVAVGTAAVIEADAGPSRVVACLAGADDASQARCQKQLEELSGMPYTQLPPSGVRIRPRPDPAVAGRPVSVPPDCHLAANDRTGLLDCGDAVLGWSEPSDPRAIPSERDATIDDTARKMRLASPGAQPPKRSSSPCRIEGVATSCSVVRWPEVTLTLGAAVVRGHSILAWCVAREGATSRICADSVNTGQPTSPAAGLHH